MSAHTFFKGTVYKNLQQNQKKTGSGLSVTVCSRRNCRQLVFDGRSGLRCAERESVGDTYRWALNTWCPVAASPSLPVGVLPGNNSASSAIRTSPLSFPVYDLHVAAIDLEVLARLVVASSAERRPY